MDVKEKPPAGLIGWEAEGIRFSSFPPPSVVFELKPLWEALVGRPPEEVQQRPQQGVYNEFGLLGDNHLFVTQQLNRIDIILGVHPSKAAISPGLPSIGDMNKASVLHLDIVSKWLKITPSLGRIAYAPTATHPVQTVEEGYSVLAKLLPRLPLDGEVRNLLWQINRPRASKVLHDLKIDRFSKWSMVTQQLMQIATDTGQVISNPQSVAYAVKAELDIYTDPFSPIPAESLQPLCEELVSAANEILVGGDLP